jgi:hypothetical protein
MWIRMRLGLVLVSLPTLTPGCGSVATSEPLTPETAQAALLDLASDPSLNGFRPEQFPNGSGAWHSNFLDTIQSPASLAAISGPITILQPAGRIRIGPFDCNLQTRSVEFGTEVGAGDERYEGILIQDPSGRWKVRIVNSWFTGW